MNLGFIGTGKIASSVITGICGSSIKYSKIFVSSRNNKIAKGEDFADWIIKFYNFLFLKRKNNKLYKKPSQKKYRKSNNQKEIDSILDKISKSGYDSLTKHEKETLFKAGKK